MVARSVATWVQRWVRWVPYPCTVPTVPTIRTQLATDLATDFYFFLYQKNILFSMISKNRLLDRSLTGYVWWVRWVRFMGTVHGYDGYGGTVDEYRTWVRWHGTWACTWVRYIGTVPNTCTRTQQRYPIPIPVTVPNNTQHPYPYPTPAPNTRTQHPYRTPVPVPVPIEMTPRTLRKRLNREACFHCFQKLIIYNDINYRRKFRSQTSDNMDR